MEFHHIGISVKSIERSADFYREIIGMNIVRLPFIIEGSNIEQVTGLQNVKVRTCVLSKGSLMLELFEFVNPNPITKDPNHSVANHGISHFGISVTNIDEIYTKMAARGVRFHSEVTTFPGGVRATYGRDPDGNVFELLELPAS
jgi:catechol 2,3-dioxygenase-like lactoylglutathione lyase family enzyme